MAKKLTSAQREAHRAEKRRLRNRAVKGATKTCLDRARSALLQGTDPAAAQKATLEAIQALDKAARKGIIHSHSAARHKSRLMKRLNTLQAQSQA